MSTPIRAGILADMSKDLKANRYSQSTIEQYACTAPQFLEHVIAIP